MKYIDHTPLTSACASFVCPFCLKMRCVLAICLKCMYDFFKSSQENPIGSASHVPRIYFDFILSKRTLLGLMSYRFSVRTSAKLPSPTGVIGEQGDGQKKA